MKVVGAAGDNEAAEFAAGLSKALCNILRGLVYSLESGKLSKGFRLGSESIRFVFRKKSWQWYRG